MEAVKQGSAALGLKSKTHTVLLALKVSIFVSCTGGLWETDKSYLQRSSSELASYQKKIFKIDEHVGIAIAGLTSDARLLRCQDL